MKTLHVLNGDSTRMGLEQTAIAGDVAVYADVLHDGPRTDDADARARFIADAGLASYEDALGTLHAWQAPLDRHAEYEQIVLWFEHDLFDQLLLIRHLAFFDDVGRRDGVFLIDSDDYLGPMSPAQLTALYPSRAEVSAAQLELGARAWRAFVAGDLDALRAIAHVGECVLPHLPGALARWLEEQPDAHGLGRLDRQVLSLLAESPRAPYELFSANARLEERVYLGDSVFFWRLRRLVERGLIQMDDVVTLTQNGAVLAKTL